ncbi:MAG: RsiV family protein, partial [Acetatifactor sp.]|nr:RsiV family protein [Acetatifactor sp.]
GRFYLTAEGIGIHFDTYELSSYASGGLDVVVPYELFDMRNPAEVGLTSF